MMSHYKHKSGAQKRKKTISKKRKRTRKIDIFFAKKATSSEPVKVATVYGLQNKASSVTEALSESKITPRSAKALDLSQPDESEFNGASAKASRPDFMTTCAQITTVKSGYFLKPDTSHNAFISQEMLRKFHPNQNKKNINMNIL